MSDQSDDAARAAEETAANAHRGPNAHHGPSDSETTVLQLKQVVRQFVDQRDWQQFHNPKNLAMSLAIEAGELMEHFQWLTLEEAADVAADPQKKHNAGEELADCLAYLLALANTMDIDVSETLRAKMVRNAIKYPKPS